MDKGKPVHLQSMTLQYQSGYKSAWEDLKQSYRLKDAWWTISQQHVLSKYRRTFLGPWWITLQRILFIVGLSFLFSSLMKIDITSFIPYVAIGFIVFGTLVSSLNGSVSLVTGNMSVLKNSSMPTSIINFRFFAANIIQLGHDFLALVVILVVLQIKWEDTTLLAIPGIALVLANSFAFSFWISPLAARFRDLGPLISSLSSVLMFITPIFWQVDDLDESVRTLLTFWNPFSYLLEVVRSPILGTGINWVHWSLAIIFTVANLGIGFLAFNYSRHKLRYWVA